jgi:hypothetical protein
MRYETLIETLSEIANNEKIETEGLTLVYELDEKNHKQMDEHLYYKGNPEGRDFKHSDKIEIEIEGLTVKFIKKENG